MRLSDADTVPTYERPEPARVDLRAGVNTWPPAGEPTEDVPHISELPMPEREQRPAFIVEAWTAEPARDRHLLPEVEAHPLSELAVVMEEVAAEVERERAALFDEVSTLDPSAPETTADQQLLEELRGWARAGLPLLDAIARHTERDAQNTTAIANRLGQWEAAPLAAVLERQNEMAAALGEMQREQKSVLEQVRDMLGGHPRPALPGLPPNLVAAGQGLCERPLIALGVPPKVAHGLVVAATVGGGVTFGILINQYGDSWGVLESILGGDL